MRAEELLDALLHLDQLGPAVRAAAIYPGSGEPVFRPRAGTDRRAAADGEYWEEAVINPTLLDLCRRCGAARHEGFDYLMVRYADGWLLMLPFGRGHVSVAFEATGDPIAAVGAVRALCERHGLAHVESSWDRA